MLLSALVTPGCCSFFHGDGEAAPRGLMWEASGDRAGLADPPAGRGGQIRGTAASLEDVCEWQIKQLSKRVEVCG